MGLRDVLRNGAERRFVTVDIPLLGSVRLRSLTSNEIRALRSSMRDAQGEVNKQRFALFDELLIALVVVDEANNCEFSEMDALNGGLEMDAGARGQLMEAIKRHTGIGADEGWSPVVAAAKN